MAYEGLQRGETADTLKRESEDLKKKLEEERNKLNDVERKCPGRNSRQSPAELCTHRFHTVVDFNHGRCSSTTECLTITQWLKNELQ